jgi:two-component system nitrate/nitrite response regulator NarL
MLVDDHHSFREPLAFMLSREPDLESVAQADSLAAARKFLSDSDCPIDVALVDLDLPDGSGTDFIGDLHRLRPRAAAIILSALSERVRLAKAIEAGADGIMHKSARLSEILDAVRRLHAGEELLSRNEVAEAFRFLLSERGKAREAQTMIGTLTPREREVLQLIAEGLGDKEIAVRLHVGVGTVRAHVARVLMKLEVSSRLQALVFAARHGVVEIT